MSSGSFIDEERHKPRWRLVNKTARKATAECVNLVHRTELKIEQFKRHIRAGTLPMSVLGEHAGRGNTSAEVRAAAPDGASPALAAAVLHACERGLQNNVGVEYYSEFMNAVARTQGIPVADMWNLTVGEWRHYHDPWPCAATEDGIHHHEPTMWKQVRLWFDLFRKER